MCNLSNAIMFLRTSSWFRPDKYFIHLYMYYHLKIKVKFDNRLQDNHLYVLKYWIKSEKNTNKKFINSMLKYLVIIFQFWFKIKKHRSNIFKNYSRFQVIIRFLFVWNFVKWKIWCNFNCLNHNFISAWVYLSYNIRINKLYWKK